MSSGGYPNPLASAYAGLHPLENEPPLTPPVLGEKGKLGGSPKPPSKGATPLCTPQMILNLVSVYIVGNTPCPRFTNGGNSIFFSIILVQSGVLHFR